MLKVIIIDDEVRGREILQTLLQKNFSEKITVCATCASASEGLEAVKQFQPDLVFLDIEMPGGSGFDFLQTLGTFTFELVFVTAYSGYAIEAFKVHALDYLLKPVNPKDLKRTIEWMEQRWINKKTTHDGRQILEKIKSHADSKNLGIPTSEGIVFLEIPLIIRCEGSSNYTYIYSEPDKKLLTSRTLKEMEKILEDHDFVRVHKSHLINLSKLSHYHRNDGIIQLKDGSEVPLGRNCKEEFEKRIFII